MRNSLSGLLGLVAALASVTFGCSSSSSAGDATGAGACTCEVSANGAKRTIACGSDTCVGGVTYSCGKNADVAQGGNCTEAPASAGDPNLCKPPQTISASQKDRCTGSCAWLELHQGGSVVATWCAPACSTAADCDQKTGQAGKYVCSASGGGVGECVPSCDDARACPAPFTTCGVRNDGRYCY